MSDLLLRILTVNRVQISKSLKLRIPPNLCVHIRERVVNTSRPGEMQVTIQNLMPDTKYRFRVVGHNSNGQGESSAAARVATQAEGTHTHAHTRSAVRVR